MVSSAKSQSRHLRALTTLLARAETFCNFLEHVCIFFNLLSSHLFDLDIVLNLQVMADEDAVLRQLLVDRDLLLFNCLQLHQGEPHPFHFVLQRFDLGLDSSLCSQRIILEVTFLVCKLMDLLGSLLNQSIHVLHRVVLVFILWFLGVTRPTRDVTSC